MEEKRTDKMLEVSALSVAYRKKGKEDTVIRDLSFTLEKGKMLAIMGRSGCGKTTLLHAVAGILPCRGRISMNGRHLSPKQVRIGLIPQDYGLLPWRTVLGNALFGIRHRSPAYESEARALLVRLGIGGLVDSYPGEISGGQAQRVALCRALLLRPEILLMDEPFSALDEAATREAQRITARLWEETTALGIIITHRMEEALFMADEIAVMFRGKEDRTELDCYANPWKGSMDVREKEYLELKYRIERSLAGGTV